MECRIDAGIVQKVVHTLKLIDVRGYDSMDRLVGLVMLFEDYLRSATPIEQGAGAEPASPTERQEG